MLRPAKHIALRARSVHKDAAYTCPGLGDRIHACTTAWAYSKAHDVPVTLHLTAPKWKGGQFNNKPQSWGEIVALFPVGLISLYVHDTNPDTEDEWLNYLHNKGIDADLPWYADHPGEREQPTSLDIAPYLKAIPLLKPEPQDVPLPDKFITVQWDSNQARRSIEQKDRERVLEAYRADGYTPLVVGGQATQKHMGWSLKRIAHAMSKAALHVGVDSAFTHLAMLYLPIDRVHLYAQSDGYVSHHAKRWQDMGVTVNHH